MTLYQVSLYQDNGQDLQHSGSLIVECLAAYWRSECIIRPIWNDMVQ